MATRINTYADIQNYVADASPAGVVALGGDAVWRVSEAIRRADHPAYGGDWSEWLDEHAERIAREAIS